MTGPDFPDAYFFRAFCFQALGRLSEAEASLRVALELMPGDTVYSCELGHLLHQRRDWEGALVRFDDAIQGLHELRSIHGAPTGASLMGMSLRDWHRRALRGRGFSLIELGRLDEAEAAYRQALALDANDTRAQTELNLIAHLRRQGLEPPGAFDDRAR
ncbi:MAG: tetratricopeptide repeat protein [Myxococcota bacterium]